MKFLGQKFKRLRPLLGTYVAIELQGDIEEELLNKYITEGFEAINEVDRLMSYHRLDSDLNRLNRARPNEWIDVHASTRAVLQISNELFLSSDGIFDIRCGKVLADCGVIPSFSQSNCFYPSIDKNMVPLEINESSVRKLGPWILDLGGIAKGFAVDCAVKKIQHMTVGLELSGVVNAGGDLRVWGNEVIPVVARIYGETDTWNRSLDIYQTALATSSVRMCSGLSENLSPAAHVQMPSGKVLRKAKTVSVLANECLLADALTKVVLLGEEDVAERCLVSYKARALIFSSEGHFEKMIG